MRNIILVLLASSFFISEDDSSTESGGTSLTGTAINSFAAFWSSTELGLDNAHYLALYDLSSNISLNNRPKSWAKAIKCLKD